MLDLFRAWRRRDILVKFARRGLGDVLLGDRPHDHALSSPMRARDVNDLTNADVAMWFGALAADVNLSAPARLLRVRAGLEQAGDVEPLIEAHNIVDCGLRIVD